MIDIHHKIKSLGDITFRKKRKEKHSVHHILEFIKCVMDSLDIEDYGPIYLVESDFLNKEEKQYYKVSNNFTGFLASFYNK